MAIEMLAVYTRATHRGIVRLNSISKDALSLLGLKDVSGYNIMIILACLIDPHAT